VYNKCKEDSNFLFDLEISKRSPAFINDEFIIEEVLNSD